MHRTSLKLLVLTAVFTLSSHAQAQNTSGTTAADRVGSVDVRIQWGNVIVKPSRDGALHYRVVRDVSGPMTDSLRQLPEAIPFDVSGTGTAWMLSITPEQSDGFVAALVEVEVPASVERLHVQMARGGAIAVDGYAGELQVVSDNGDVYLSELGGPVSVTALNGEIRAGFAETSANAPITLLSRNGGLWLQVPADTRGDFEVETRSGAIRSDLPLSIEELPGAVRSAQYRPRRATLRMAGGPSVRLMTLNGDVDVAVR